MNLVERTNEAPLDAELMKRLLTRIDEMPADQRGDFTGRGIGLMRFLQEIRERDEPSVRASILTAFVFRMEALSELRNRPEYRGWAMKSKLPKDPDLINEVLIETAATHPLIERDKRPVFDPVSFFRAVLERAEADGHA